MKRNIQLLLNYTSILLVFIFVISCSKQSNNDSSEHVKVSLREVGHQLLLNNLDSTSVVKPIVALDKNKYQISFESTLTIHPDSLVSSIKYSLNKAGLPQHYLVEVLQCKDDEVAYSYKMNIDLENGIIPCKGRKLKNACYLITVGFTDVSIENEQNISTILYSIGLGLVLLFSFIVYKKKQKSRSQKIDNNFASIGRFKFYPEQNMLIKEAIEISLSKKECEILAIFVAHPNQIIKRDELTKKVWEDNGVIVGRSLDTYISKLRKKLKEDDSIKLTNVHGVGYKLEL